MLLKIALVNFRGLPSVGGAERYTADLAAALVDKGHEAVILCSDQAELGGGVDVVKLAAGGLTRTGKYLRFLDSLEEHLRAEKYDIVHAMLPVRECDVYHPHAGLAAAIMQRPANRFNRKRRRFALVHVARFPPRRPRRPRSAS